MNAKAAHVARLDAAVAGAETAKAEERIEALRTHALAVLGVSHNLDQVFGIADRVRVLRRDAQAGTCTVAGNERAAMTTGVG